MSKIKLLVVLACMTLGFANAANSQIYESEACFYASAGSSSVSRIVRFEGPQDRVWVKTCGFSRQKLAESEYYYENETWTDGKDCAQMYEYDYSMSTSQRVVYKRVEKIAIHSYDCANLRGYGRTDVCEFFGSFGNSPRGCGRHGYKDGDTYYVAFSKDLSSFIYWRVRASDVDKQPTNKQTFTRVPKEDLLPKAANYDFLNE